MTTLKKTLLIMSLLGTLINAKLHTCFYIIVKSVISDVILSNGMHI
jgi:hypothetical protein